MLYKIEFFFFFNFFFFFFFLFEKIFIFFVFLFFFFFYFFFFLLLLLAKNLKVDWSSSFINSELKFPLYNQNYLNINWIQYKSWDFSKFEI